MENLTGGTPPVRYLPCVVPCKLYFDIVSSSYELCEDIIKEIVHMRQYNNLSQNELADISGVRQPMIARIEHGINTPNMSTVLKLLAAFGKTLYIGDLKNVELEDGADSVAADEDLTTE